MRPATRAPQRLASPHHEPSARTGSLPQRALYQARPAPERPYVGRRREVLLALATNLVLLLGLLLGYWPAGNVLLLLWVENVVLGAWTVVKIMTARVDPETRHPFFFVLHYGIFCTAHFVFIGVLTVWMGPEFTFLGLMVPIVLIAFRHTIDTLTVWFGSRVNERTTPTEAASSPYPPLIVLHVATIIAWGLMVGSLTLGVQSSFGSAGGIDWPSATKFQDFLTGLGLPLGDGVIVALIVVLVKTVDEVLVAWSQPSFTLGPRPSRTA